MNRVGRLMETPFLQLTAEQTWRLKRTSVRISIRICYAALALSSVKMATCDPNSIGLIMEDKCRD